MSTYVVRFQEDVTTTRGELEFSGGRGASCSRSRSMGKCVARHRVRQPFSAGRRGGPPTRPRLGPPPELKFAPLASRDRAEMDSAGPEAPSVDSWWKGLRSAADLARFRAAGAGGHLDWLRVTHVQQRLIVGNSGGRLPPGGGEQRLARDHRSYSFVQLRVAAGDAILDDSTVVAGSPGEAAEAIATAAARLAEMCRLKDNLQRRGGMERLPARGGGQPSPLVLLSGSAAFFFVHEVCAHALEGDAMASRTSVLSSLRGRQVAPPFLTISDVTRLEGCPASLRVDDEGNYGGETSLIKDGVLTGSVFDVNWSLTTGSPLTGNGRRQNHRTWALPRAAITVVGPGSGSDDELASRMDSGYIIPHASGGRANVVTGGFEFTVPIARVVRNGRPAGWTGPCVVSGRIETALSGLLAVGAKPELWTQLCGKGGQPLPVGAMTPPLLSSGLSVGVDRAR